MIARTASSRSRDLSSLLIIVAACFGAGVAFWLLPASVDIVAWSAAGPTRVALLAPLARLWMALGAAGLATVLLIAASRDKAVLAARAGIVAPLAVLWLWTVPYLPLLSDRAPVLLILAGPLRWLIAGTAAIGVMIRWMRARGLSPTFPPPGRMAIFVISLVLYVGLGLRSLATVGLSGDEPHYLVITHSLLVDHDLKIENNHARGDYRTFFRGPLNPDYLRRGKNGDIYSIHLPGLSALVLPGYAVAGASGAVMTMCLVGALAAVAVYGIGFLVGGRTVALLTWTSICLTVPFIPHSWMLYPEMAGAAIVAWALLWLLSPLPEQKRVWVARGACLAALPWLHAKFALLLAALVPLLLWRLRTRIKESAMLLLPIAAGGLAWLAYFYVIYGSLDPQVAYGQPFMERFIHIENIPRSLLGLLLDQKFGLLVYAPVYVLTAVGFILLLRDRERHILAVALLVTAGPFLVSSARLIMWWGGSSPPARFLVPLLPLLAAPMAAALGSVRGRVGRATMAISLALSLLIAAAGVVVPDRLFLLPPDPHGTARLFEAVEGSAPLVASLPTFTEQNWTRPLASSLPWIIAAAAALGVAFVAAARAGRLNLFWIGSLEAVTFLLVGSLLTSRSAASTRADSVMRGRTALMTAYDPDRLRGFDYGSMTRVDADALRTMAPLSIQRSPETPVDAQGRVAAPPALPPGRYEARVWFRGQGERDGDLLLSARRGNVLARMHGPLVNPATIAFDLPAQLGFVLSLSERSSAEAVDRVEIIPLSIVPKSGRVDAQARAVEAIAGRPNAYIVYVDDETYPEGGVFWTRGANRGDVLIATAGASEIMLTLHVGPISGTVRLTVDGQPMDVSMVPNETRVVPVPVRAGTGLVRVGVQAPASFRPSAVDPNSTDTRALGCQVRVELR